MAGGYPPAGAATPVDPYADYGRPASGPGYGAPPAGGPAFAATGPQGAPGPMYPVVSQKSRVVAGILGLLLGSYGAHNFYLGYTNKAIIQLVLTLVGLVLSLVIIGYFIVLGVAIWALVEAIQIFTSSGDYHVDANGVPLTN